MATDLSIYGNLLRPPKTVQEYGAEMDAAEGNRLGLEQARANLLGLQRAQQDEDAVRKLYQQPDFNAQTDDGIAQLMRVSPKAGAAAYAAQLAGKKTQAETEHLSAQTAGEGAKAQKAQIEAAGEKLKQYRSALDFVDTPQGAARWLKAQFDDPLTASQMGALGSFEQAVTRIPQDPKGFEDWRAKAGMGMEKHLQQLQAASAAAETARHNKAGESLTARGQNMTDARSRETNSLTREAQQTQIVNDPNQGILLVNKGTGVTRPAVGANGSPIPSENAVANKKMASQLGEGIKLARELIPKATASGAGAALDSAAGFFGRSTEGADAASQLDTLAGWMTSNVPKMSGPQSDKDVLLYRQMAAQVGDRTKPASQRLAALDTLETLQQKYSVKQPDSPAGSGASGGWSVVEVK